MGFVRGIDDKELDVYVRFQDWTPEEVLCLMERTPPDEVDFDDPGAWVRLSCAYDALTTLWHLFNHPSFRREFKSIDPFTPAWMKTRFSVRAWLGVFRMAHWDCLADELDKNKRKRT